MEHGALEKIAETLLSVSQQYNYPDSVVIGKLNDGQLIAVHDTAKEVAMHFRYSVTNQPLPHCLVLASLREELYAYFAERGVSVGEVKI